MTPPCNELVSVILPVYNGYNSLKRCIDSLLAHQGGLDPAIEKLLILDDASTDERVGTLLSETSEISAKITYVRNNYNIGYLANVNQGLDRISGSVILLNSDTIVPRHWATRMVAGAKNYPRLGALTPLSNNATFSTIPHPLDISKKIDNCDPDSIQDLLDQAGFTDYPLAPTGMGFCLLLTTLARSIVHRFDEYFAPGYEEENDLCQQLRAHGLQCRIATDVYVHHEGGQSFGIKKRELQQRHYQLMLEKHPTYDAVVREWFHEFDYPYQMLGCPTNKVWRVLLDGSVLSQAMTGVVRYVEDTGRIFADQIKSGHLILSIVLEEASALRNWQSRYPWIEWLASADLNQAEAKWDIYHLCHLNASLKHVLNCYAKAHRFVLTIHDLIAYENPSYFKSGEAYLEYKSKLKILASLADCIIGISDTTLRDLREQLMQDLQRSRLFANPVGHLLFESGLSSAEPVIESPYCLIVGTDFKHKNLLNTVRLFEEAFAEDSPKMQLRIVGPRVTEGGVIHDLLQTLKFKPGLANHIILEGPVSDSRLKHLYQSAKLVLYLSLQEGFGYVPYEAAACSCPTLVANTSVYSQMPEWIAVNPYLCDETLRAIKDTAINEGRRKENVLFWRKLMEQDATRKVDRELIKIYEDTCMLPRDYGRKLMYRYMKEKGETPPVRLPARDRIRKIKGYYRLRKLLAPAARFLKDTNP